MRQLHHLLLPPGKQLKPAVSLFTLTPSSSSSFLIDYLHHPWKERERNMKMKKWGTRREQSTQEWPVHNHQFRWCVFQAVPNFALDFIPWTLLLPPATFNFSHLFPSLSRIRGQVHHVQYVSTKGLHDLAVELTSSINVFIPKSYLINRISDFDDKIDD